MISFLKEMDVDITKQEIDSRYKKLLIDFLVLTIRDIKYVPGRVGDLQRIKLLETNKRDALWFIFRSNGLQGLSWWCDLLGISSLRVKRRARSILDKQK